MFDSLFGAELPLTVRFLIAFVIVLVLIGVTFWLIRRFGAERLGAGAARGRQPRLAVIDAAAVDGRRRLVLIRRDNVEHLVMIGGPSDIVIEQNIVRAVPVSTPREMPVPARGPETRADAPRAPQSDEAWEGIQPEPPARAPRRPAEAAPPALEEPAVARAPVPEESRRQTPPMPRIGEAMPRVLRPLDVTPRRDRPAAPPLEPSVAPEARPSPPEPPRKEPAAQQPAAGEAPHESSADANLAEMAQRLEAALRRPLSHSGEQRPSSPPKPAEPERAQPPSPPRPIGEAGRAETPRAPEPHPPAEPTPAKPETKPPSSKSVFDSLEEEMASLLGRPKSKE